MSPFGIEHEPLSKAIKPSMISRGAKRLLSANKRSVGKKTYQQAFWDSDLKAEKDTFGTLHTKWLVPRASKVLP